MATLPQFIQSAGKWLGVLPAAAPEPEARMAEAAGLTIDADEHLYRPLTSDVQRNLSPVTHDRMQKMAVYLWETNLLANRLIELPIAFMLAQGVKLTVADDGNQKVLDRFWNDPINEMDMKLPKKLRELSIFGEQCYPAFVNEGNGLVRLGYLDPANINTVVMDPDNPEQPIGVVTKKDRKDKARKYRVIINGPEDVFTDRTQQIRANDFPDGDCFFFRVNDLSSGSRGRSDLLPQIDWLDAYDEFLFGELDRAKFLRSFLWDVTLKGATPEDVKKRASEFTAPSANSVRVHNDSEEWKTETPTLNSADSSEQARLLRNHILGGSTMPEHWFGGGGDVNRNAASEMGEPTFKMYSMRQNTFRYMLESMGRFQLRQEFKRTNKDAEPDYGLPQWQPKAQFPEMVSKDVSKFTAALSQAAVGAAAAIAQGLITKANAARILEKIAAELGVSYDADDEIEAVLKEKQKQAEDDANMPPLPGSEDPAPAAGANSGDSTDSTDSTDAAA